MEKDMNAIGIVKQMVADGQVSQEVAERYFPELKESEDERIRKEFCEDIWTFIPNEKAHKYIAWLEKQGEQKDSYTKQQLRDMGFAFTLNGDIVTPEITNEAIKEYLANEKKKWEKEQKPAWSEEDEEIRNFVFNIFKDSQRFGVSETIMPEQFNKIFDWLKSLKDKVQPQSQWKPSIAQLNALSIVSKGNAPDDIEAIVSLYQDLKKLREE